MTNNSTTRVRFLFAVMALGTVAIFTMAAFPNVVRAFYGLPFSLAFLCFWSFPAHRLAQMTADVRKSKGDTRGAKGAMVYVTLKAFEIASFALALLFPLAIIGATR